MDRKQWEKESKKFIKDVCVPNMVASGLNDEEIKVRSKERLQKSMIKFDIREFEDKLNAKGLPQEIIAEKSELLHRALLRQVFKQQGRSTDEINQHFSKVDKFVNNMQRTLRADHAMREAAKERSLSGANFR